ncbi:oxidoreductase [Novacetimonas hansenii]|uniref:Oxidoreductase n=1 Tax=Novacetimonas hansenii TaxID=436 RepID=A0ABQ0SK93_NOVHA|nr:oxidoreductase [Novacetimonas hansenii]
MEALVSTLPVEVLTVMGDVTDDTVLLRLRDQTLTRFGDVGLLVNNVGVLSKAGPWDSPDEWDQTLNVNFRAVLSAQHLFVPHMIAANRPSAVVNLGSKEGITTPPGHAAYSVAKAAVKVLTEQLAHELLVSTGGSVSAHLLVPGYTWTPMNFHGKDGPHDRKPEAAWTAEQVVDYFLQRLFSEDFYILCPDNEVTSEMDMRRIQWSADDMIHNRPALSRWNPAWAQKFMQWMKEA